MTPAIFAFGYTAQEYPATWCDLGFSLPIRMSKKHTGKAYSVESVIRER